MSGLESEQKPILRDERGLFQEGTVAGPGRPKGRFSLTSLIIKQLESNPNQTKDIIEWLLANRKDLIWQMIDPKPPTDLNLGGEVSLPVRIIEVIKPVSQPDEPVQTVS